MKKTPLLLVILALAVSVPVPVPVPVPASADPIMDKINAYNAMRKKDLKSLNTSIPSERKNHSDPLPRSNSNDSLGDARLSAALSLSYATSKSLETVRDAFKSPTRNDYAGRHLELRVPPPIDVLALVVRGINRDSAKAVDLVT